MGAKAIKHYAELCLLANREPLEAEFLAFAYFGIVPMWVEELIQA